MANLIYTTLQLAKQKINTYILKQDRDMFFLLKQTCLLSNLGIDIDYNTVLLHVPRLRRSPALWSFNPDPGVAPDAAALLTQLCAVWLPSHTSPGDPSPPLCPRQGESDPLSRPEFFLGLPDASLPPIQGLTSFL